MTGVLAAVQGWLFSPLPRGRVAALRFTVYAFVILDVLFIRPWVDDHGSVPGDLYHPLFFGRLLPLPTPGPGFVRAVQLLLLLSAAAALSGKWPRVAGWAVFALYLEWMFIAFSYGKVDHDRFAFLVALAVLPTVGPARWGDRSRDEASGWALRFVQIAVVATYFLAAFAKLRFGGIEWLTGATLMRAVLRRGTFLGDPLTDYPWLLQISQFLVVAFELSTPLLLVRGRTGAVFLALAFGFHLVTFATIGIMFWPHVVCLLSFLPLERIEPQRLLGRERAAGAASGGQWGPAANP